MGTVKSMKILKRKGMVPALKEITVAKTIQTRKSPFLKGCSINVTTEFKPSASGHKGEKVHLQNQGCQAIGRDLQLGSKR